MKTEGITNEINESLGKHVVKAIKILASFCLFLTILFWPQLACFVGLIFQ